MSFIAPFAADRSWRAAVRMVAGLCAMAAAWVAAPAAACTVTSSMAVDFGTFSPVSLQRAAVPAQQSRAGLKCDASLVTVLGSSYIRAKLTSQNGLKLSRQGGGGSIAYVASADPNGTYAFSQGGTVDYMQNNLLNALGLLGGSSVDLPFFLRPAATLPPVGVYTDRIRIDWSWYLCPGGVSLAGLCVGTLDTSSGQSASATAAIVDVTMTVGARDVTVQMTWTSTWDPVNGTSNARAFPGSRRRLTANVANPDLIALDSGSVALVVATPPGTAVALDGDGSGSTDVVRLSDGSPPSTLTIRYGGPGDTTDDVDFSSDGGNSWSYVPAVGNVASEAAVTHVRVRPRGSMARQSSLAVSLPYLLR